MSVKQQVIQARLDGSTYGEIYHKFGVPKSTAQDWVYKYKNNEFYEIPRGVPPSNPKEVKGVTNFSLKKINHRSTKYTEEEILGFINDLSPIVVKSAIKPKSRNSYSDYVIVMNDLHFPLHCQKTIDVALTVIDELSPREIILNGDTVDMLAVSRYPKDIRMSHSLFDERVAYHKFLDLLLEVSGYATIYETDANHSGNGSDGRWFRFLSDRLGELASLPEIAEKLSYADIFLGEYKEYVQNVDSVMITDSLIVTHGDVVRKHGGYSARGVLEKYYHSMIVGHTHRLGMSAQRIPGLGNRDDQQIYVWENGCMCDLNPIYASSPNWQNGFSIVSLDGGGNFGVEQVLVQNGTANVATLGKTIKV